MGEKELLMSRACRFTAPYGSRQIWLDGKPFLAIQSQVPSGHDRVDDVAREIKKLLCGEKKSKSSFAGVFDFLKRKKKPRVNPMSKRMIWEPGKPARMFGRARKRRRR